ncbi:Mat89Ba [Drosophila busckii]|uniref:Nucleolar protein 6 n=1 Tax=Drosophila busckii TaxID=30019 RepID=A0A0M4F302_DROBS|nr:nucleolar protein 6 [Drosophila busckii]ALC45900.1 Mat89Ba [Drosophila busckii]
MIPACKSDETELGFLANKNNDGLQTKQTKKLKNNTSKVKPPTVEEIKELNETRNLFHSNLFRLQVKEMLSEVSLKPKYTNYIEAWLETFKTAVQKLESGLLDTCQMEVPLHLCKKPLNFQFLTPRKPPVLMGAASTNTLIGPKIVLDVALEMPPECFQKDDCLNLVHDQKRALYLASVASKLKELPIYMDAHFCYNYYANNPLKPIIELTPDNKFGKRLLIRLFITAPLQVYKLNRFVPWNNNIRPSVFGGKLNENDCLPSTQHYNSSVLFDLTQTETQKMLSELFKDRPNFQEGLILLKIWLRQRQLDVGFSGFSAHILASYIVYLNKERLLNKTSSSYQVARTVWNQLASSDWTQGISLCPQQPHPLTTLRTYFDVCFMDVTGYYNLCANLSIAIYEAVRGEAKLTVDLLNDVKINSFTHIFMQKIPLYTRTDHILKITDHDCVAQLLQLHTQPQTMYDYAGYAYPQLLKLLTEILKKGLGKRVRSIMPLEVPSSAWPVYTKAPVIGCSIILALMLDPNHAYEVLDKGPAANEDKHAVTEFRKFWGEKSSLRRFQDGSITEAVVWASATDSPSQKRLIVRQIVMWLLENHLQVEPKNVYYIAGELDIVFKLTPSFKLDKVQTKLEVQQNTDAEALTPHLIHCFDALSRQLYSLKGLPLDIVSISGISAAFRYCEPQPILPQSRPIGKHLHAIHVHHAIIQLSSSGKWPNELGALRALKTALLIKIGQQLKAQHLHCQLCNEGLMVVKQGYCYLLELAHSKELTLLKQLQTEHGIPKHVNNQESRELMRRHYVLPRVNGALHALHQKHGAYGPTVLIAKRWLASQLLDDGLWPPMATELLVAYLYLQGQIPHTTVSPQTGFVRFLHLLSYSNWKSELFLLNFDNNWPDQHMADLEIDFCNDRQSYPSLCVVTAYDQHHAGHLWTNDNWPNKSVLGRITLLAAHALKLIESSLYSDAIGFVRPAQLFKASNDGYDLVIQLKPEMLSSTLCYEHGSPFLSNSQRNFRLPLANCYQLSQIVKKLRSAYSDYAAFFYNPHGGKELAIVWRPVTDFAPKVFKVNELHACVPFTDTKQVQVKRETLLEDFKLLLKDFYLRVCTLEELALENRHHKRYFSQSKQIIKSDVPSKKKKMGVLLCSKSTKAQKGIF